MGDKAIISEILEASHLTDAYQQFTAQHIFEELGPKKKERAEGDSVKYEGLEEEKGEGRVQFGSTLSTREEASTSRQEIPPQKRYSDIKKGHNSDIGPFDIGSEEDIPSDDDQSGLFPLLHSKATLHSSPIRGERRDRANPYSSEEDLLFREDTFTVDQAVDALGFGKFQIKLSLLTGLAWMADAMEMMILSILSPALHCDWWLSSWEQAMITTVVFCGMMLSSTVWGNITDTYGRKSGLVLCSALTFYFGVLSGLSPTFFWLLILRGLVGFGIGGVPQSVTLYAEFLPSTHRAKCVVLIESFWAIGTCFEVVLAIFVMPTLGWRWLLVFSAIPLAIFLISCLWLPESARYHMACGQPELAYATLERVARENGKPMLLGKLVETRGASVVEAKRGRIVDLFVPELWQTTLLLWFIWMSNAFSYYGIVLFTTKLYESGGSCHGGDPNHNSSAALCPLECTSLTHNDYVDLLWTTLAEFPGLILTAVIIEWMGRKKTMAFEFAVFSFFTFLLFPCLNRPTVTAFIFIARAFISGCFQAAYVYTPEVYPTTTRAIGLGTCSGFARLGAIITPFVAQVATETSVNIPISIYGVVCVLGAIAAMMLPIETKGREMKDTHH